MNLDLFDSEVEEAFQNFTFTPSSATLPPFSVSVLCVHEENQLLSSFVSRVVWPSSLFLSHYFCANTELICDKSIVELGAGTGVLGLSLSKLQPQQVTLTDSCQSSISVGQQSVQRNNAQEVCKVEKLTWGNMAEEQDVIEKLNETRNAEEPQVLGFDMVVAADVVYEPDLIEALISTGTRLLKDKQSKFYLANHKDRFDKYEDRFWQAIHKLNVTASKQELDAEALEKLEEVVEEARSIRFFVIQQN